MGDTILDRALKGEQVKTDRWTLMALIVLLSKVSGSAQWQAKRDRYRGAVASHPYAGIDCEDIETALQDLVDTVLKSMGLKTRIAGRIYCIVERATA